MPKAKPDQVIVHRIELQKSERDALEAALAGKFVTNGIQAAGSVLSGIGNMLAPFGLVFAGLATLWIADRTWEEVEEATKKKKEEIIDDIATGQLNVAYIAFSNYINSAYADGGPSAVVRAMRDWPVDVNSKKKINPIKPDDIPTSETTATFLAVEMIAFIRWWISLEEELLTDSRYANIPPGTLWAEYYPIEQAASDAYYYMQKLQTAQFPIMKIFGWA
jgi:hypothetical protein